MTQTLSLENFTKETGIRFRMTKEQTARVELTKVSAEDREKISRMTVDEAADYFKARNPKGKPHGWVKLAIALAAQWGEDATLTREAAFQEFIASDGVSKLRKRKPEVPTSVWLDPELTLENFEAKTFAATGHKIRFRILKEQTARNLSRQEALTEIINQKRNEKE